MGIIIHIENNAEAVVRLEPATSYLLVLLSDVTSPETRYKTMNPLERALHNERKAELRGYLASGYTFPEEAYPFTVDGIIYIFPYAEQLRGTNVIPLVQPFDRPVLIEDEIPPVRLEDKIPPVRPKKPKSI